MQEQIAKLLLSADDIINSVARLTLLSELWWMNII
jgi:hypothetical protein